MDTAAGSDNSFVPVSFLMLYDHIRPPGWRVQPHNHPDYWEMLFVTQGVIEATTGDRVTQGGAGSIYIRPPGSPHHETILSNEPARLWVLGWIDSSQVRASPIEAFDSTGELSGGLRWLNFMQELKGPRHPLLDALTQTVVLSCSLAIQSFKPDRLTKVLAYIEKHLDGDLTLAGLAREACVSESQLSHEFKLKFGRGLMSHVRSLRLQRASRLLQGTNYLLRQIANECGFRDEYEFSRIFRRVMGFSPTELRAGFAVEAAKVNPKSRIKPKK